MPSRPLGVAVPLLTSTNNRWIAMPLPVAVAGADAEPVDPSGKRCVERSTKGERAERLPADVVR